MLDMISIFLNLLLLDLWLKMWSVLENVPCAFEKKMYSSAFGWKVLKIAIRSIWSNVSFKVCISLLIFCFDGLSVGESRVLKYPTVIVLLSISPRMLVFALCIIYTIIILNSLSSRLLISSSFIWSCEFLIALSFALYFSFFSSLFF